MPTLHEHRILIVAPLLRVAAVVTRLRNRMGADACPDDLGPGLSPPGNEPATHRVCCFSAKNGEARQILSDMVTAANNAGATPALAMKTLAEWNAMTRSQKRQWLASVRAAMLAAFGVYITLADNEGAWDDPGGVLDVLGLQRLGALV